MTYVDFFWHVSSEPGDRDDSLPLKAFRPQDGDLLGSISKGGWEMVERTSMILAYVRWGDLMRGTPFVSY
jgi:hypothetical protein